MQPRFRIRLTTPAGANHATAETEAAAMALARAFELQHAGNPDAYATVRKLDGTDAGQGRKVHDWWGGERAGPRDTRNPMETLFRNAVRSGARVVVIADGDRWVINGDEPVALTEITQLSPNRIAA